MTSVLLLILRVILFHVTLMRELIFTSADFDICASRNIDTTTRVFCNREPVRLECLDTQYISDINSVNYGRTTDPYCSNINYPEDSKVITDCTDQSNAKRVILKKCLYKESCLVGQNEFNSSDCGIGSRYVSVTYSCHEVIDLTGSLQLNDATACQDEELTLDCPHPEKIIVSSATYGRKDPGLCYREDKNTNALTCRAPNSLSIVESHCEGNITCTIKATDSQFGVICPEIYKYLQVMYICNSMD